MPTTAVEWFESTHKPFKWFRKFWSYLKGLLIIFDSEWNSNMVKIKGSKHIDSYKPIINLLNYN